MASIVRRYRKDGSSTYRIGYRQDGRMHFTPTMTDPAGAAEMLSLVDRLGPDAALAIQRQRTGRTTTDVPLLRDWCARHLDLLAADATPGTIGEYRRMAARTWLPRLGPLPVDAISTDTVREWIAWQRHQVTRTGGNYRPKSIRNAHGLLSSVLASAVEAGYMTRNPARGVRLPSDAADHEMNIFTGDEWHRFIAAMDEHYRPLTMFLVVTGCRFGEATAVQAGDLDLERRTVRFRRAWKKGDPGVYLGALKTKRGLRTVVLSPAMVEALRPLVDQLDPGAFVFTSRQGARVPAQHYRERFWRPAMTRAGITKPLTPHSLRHTGASWLLADGVSPIVVQHRLGHESLATTSKVYAHLLTDAQVGAADVMERATAQIGS